MLHNLLVVFATHVEAQRSLENVQAKEIVANKLYTFSKGSIVISGMGCLAASSAVSAFGKDATEVWNLGVAGSLSTKLALDQVVEISTVIRNPILPDEIDRHSHTFHTRLFPVIHTAAEGHALVSSDYPIHHPELKQRLSQQADLVDMEGYGIAFAAQELGIPVRIWKAVSDFANPQGPQLIQERMDHSSQILAKVLQGQAMQQDRHDRCAAG